jgi:hypothetical protein
VDPSRHWQSSPAFEPFGDGMATKSAKTKSAKPVKPTIPPSPPTKEPSSPTRSNRVIRQEIAAKRRRQQNLMVAGGAAMLIVIIALIVFFAIRANQPIVGESVYSSQGNIHVEFGSQPTLAYNSTPPSSGPHYDNLAAWNIYAEPQRYELLIHNLEDGGVIVYYQCPEGCADTVKQLETIVDPYLRAGRHVVLAPNDPTWTDGGGTPLHQDMGAKIAVVAWTRVLKLDDVDEAKIHAFIEHYEGKDHHVAGIG